MNLRSLSLVSVLLATTGALAVDAPPAVQRNCQVVDLRDATGEVKFDLVGTVLLPTAAGKARIELELKKAEAPLALDVKGLAPPSQIREEYLTYVVWRILESGATVSLGELRRDAEGARFTAEVPRKHFGLIVTAEPYFAVPRPSDTVVLEARPTFRAAKRLRPVEVGCELLPRGSYNMGRSQESLELLFASESKTPLELLQARNAVDIARLAGAERYAKDRLDEATRQLLQANALLRSEGAPKRAAGTASEAVVTAELARQIALQRAVDEATMTGEVERARREAAAAAQELERVRLEGRLETERRAAAEQLAAAEQRLNYELALREAIEQSRETEASTPPPWLRSERNELEEERQAVQGEIERMRGQLDAERERLLNDVAKQIQTQAELERARMQVDLAEERAELKVERARLEAERRILDAREQRPEPTPSLAAEPAPPAQPPAPEASGSPMAAGQARLAEREEWERLSAEVSASREALAIEQAELRALHEELRAELDVAQHRRAAPAAETTAEGSAEATEKRRWWFGRKKAKPGTPGEPVVMMVSESDLDEEWQWIQAEQARLTAERAGLDAQRRELEEKNEQVEAKKQRWWFGGKKREDAPTETVVVRESAMAAELAGLDAERTRLRAEADSERAKLAAERAALESDMELHRAELEAQKKEMRIEQLDRRLAELEAGAKAEPPEASRSTDPGLQAERAAIKTPFPAELARVSPESEEPAWRPDLADLLGAEQTPRGLIVRMPDLSFEIGKHALRPEAREQLARVAGVLQSTPGVRIEIEGHTDNTGDPALNRRLSELRAAAVMEYLATKNLPLDAMRSRGMGDTRPVASNETREGRSRNRRVELIVKDDEVTAANRAR